MMYNVHFLCIVISTASTTRILFGVVWRFKVQYLRAQTRRKFTISPDYVKLKRMDPVSSQIKIILRVNRTAQITEQS
jgi:hypothetical protein